MRNVLFLFFLALALSPQSLLAQESQKHRLLVLTDIEADPDDTQSLIRLLLYSNLIDIEGLVATTSVHQKSRVAPESIERVIPAYGKVQPNLSLHESGFPTGEELFGLVKQGLAHLGPLAQNAVRGCAPIRQPSGAYLGRGACLCFSAPPDSGLRAAASVPVTPGVVHSSVLRASAP